MGSKKKKSKAAPMPKPENPAPEVDNDELLDDLMAQIDEGNTSQQVAATVVEQVQLNKADEIEAAAGKKDSRARFEARKFRKAAEHAARFTHDDKEADARIEQEARHEEKVIKAVCDDLGLIMYEINPDGHCLYAAIADQLRILNILPPAVAHYGTTRAAAAAYMFSHPDAFLPFLPSTEGEDGVGAGNAGLMSPRQFHSYCENSGTPPIVVHDPDGVDGASLDDKRVVRISYHRRMYGLGEHYNSLRPKSLTQQIKSIFE